MQRALDLDASPPLSYALRFFVSAPAYVLLTVLLLFYAGPIALGSRWQPAILAATHLLALGAIAQTMFGALLQIMPVATGIHIFKGPWRVTLIHLTLNLGTLCLATGFLTYKPLFFLCASALLAASFIIFLLSVAWALWRDRKLRTKGAPTILMAIRLSIVSLVLAVGLGLYLSTHFGLSAPVDRWWTNLHVAWALFGWIGLLVIGISFQVIPIFQVTERYPNPITHWLAPVLFVGLLILSYGLTRSQGALWTAALLLGFCLYALISLKLLHKRKRPSPDTTTIFWRTSFICLILTLPLWLLLSLDAWPSRMNELTVLLGGLALLGFAWSAINGMLYTILPFLLWYNAQRNSLIVIRSLPRVHQYLPDAIARPQFYVHLGALLLLLAAFFWPQFFFYPALVVLGLSILWLYKNITIALRKYQSALNLIQTTLAQEQQNKP
ncbi:MAG TPA: hypothetical protein VK051_05805 [Paenalcaligenes sp.]|nr:hypothetical protein [Paenalcaligenes sp.]